MILRPFVMDYSHDKRLFAVLCKHWQDSGALRHAHLESFQKPSALHAILSALRGCLKVLGIFESFVLHVLQQSVPWFNQGTALERHAHIAEVHLSASVD